MIIVIDVEKAFDKIQHIHNKNYKQVSNEEELPQH